MREDDVRTDDFLHRPIAAFHEDIRLDSSDKFAWAIFVEKGHEIDRTERRENDEPLLLRHEWPGGSLQPPNGSIRIETHHETVSE